MKQKLTFFAVLMMAMAMPKVAWSYDFSYTYQGKTLYYNIVNNEACIVYPGTMWIGGYTGYTSLSGDIVIPDSVLWNGTWYTVSRIIQGTFLSNDITSITIPRSIKFIENNAFPSTSSFPSLNAVYYKGTLAEWCNIDFGGLYANPLYAGRRLFINNQLVTDLIIPEGVDSIKSYSFIHMHMTTTNGFSASSYLDTIILPSTLKYIGDYAFELDYYEKELVIPDSVTHIGAGAFHAATFSHITLPSHLDTIRELTFAECPFSSITLPDSLVYIGDYAFRACRYLQSIEIPAKVNHIGEYAFGPASTGYNSSSLSHIIFLNHTPPTISSRTFYGSWRNPQTGQYHFHSLDWISGLSVSINVPCQSVELYRSAMYWDSIAANIFPVDVCQWDITVQANIDSLGSVLGSGSFSDGQIALLTAIPHGGISFVGWNDGNLENPRELLATSDTSITAIFALHDTTYINVPYAVHDTIYINVPYAVHDTTIIVDTLILTEYVPVHDTTYVPVHDTTYITLTDTLTITLYDTIINTVFDTIDNYIHDTTLVTDTLWLTQYDTVINYIHDTTIVTDTLWLVQYDTVWIYDTIIIHDTIYINQEGIDGAESLSVKVYSSQGQIVVEGADGNSVTLYDISGRVLATKLDEYAPLRFDVTASGVYMLKIGNHPARKVVVIR